MARGTSRVNELNTEPNRESNFFEKLGTSYKKWREDKRREVNRLAKSEEEGYRRFAADLKKAGGEPVLIKEALSLSGESIQEVEKALLTFEMKTDLIEAGLDTSSRFKIVDDVLTQRAEEQELIRRGRVDLKIKNNNRPEFELLQRNIDLELIAARDGRLRKIIEAPETLVSLESKKRILYRYLILCHVESLPFGQVINLDNIEAKVRVFSGSERQTGFSKALYNQAVEGVVEFLNSNGTYERLFRGLEIPSERSSLGRRVERPVEIMSERRITELLKPLKERVRPPQEYEGLISAFGDLEKARSFEKDLIDASNAQRAAKNANPQRSFCEIIEVRPKNSKSVHQDIERNRNPYTKEWFVESQGAARSVIAVIRKQLDPQNAHLNQYFENIRLDFKIEEALVDGVFSAAYKNREPRLFIVPNDPIASNIVKLACLITLRNVHCINKFSNPPVRGEDFQFWDTKLKESAEQFKRGRLVEELLEGSSFDIDHLLLVERNGELLTLQQSGVQYRVSPGGRMIRAGEGVRQNHDFNSLRAESIVVKSKARQIIKQLIETSGTANVKVSEVCKALQDFGISSWTIENWTQESRDRLETELDQIQESLTREELGNSPNENDLLTAFQVLDVEESRLRIIIQEELVANRPLETVMRIRARVASELLKINEKISLELLERIEFEYANEGQVFNALLEAKKQQYGPSTQSVLKGIISEKEPERSVDTCWNKTVKVGSLSHKIAVAVIESPEFGGCPLIQDVKEPKHGSFPNPELIYRILTSLDPTKNKAEKKMDSFFFFISNLEEGNFELSRESYKQNGHLTLVGLAPLIGFETLLAAFLRLTNSKRDAYTGLLSQSEIRELRLEQASSQAKNSILEACKFTERQEKRGAAILGSEGQRILIDEFLEKPIYRYNGKEDELRALGYDILIQSNLGYSIKITYLKDDPPRFELKPGIEVKGNTVIIQIPKTSEVQRASETPEESLPMSLREVIQKITGLDDEGFPRGVANTTESNTKTRDYLERIQKEETEWNLVNLRASTNEYLGEGGNSDLLMQIDHVLENTELSVEEKRRRVEVLKRSVQIRGKQERLVEAESLLRRARGDKKPEAEKNYLAARSEYDAYISECRYETALDVLGYEETLLEARMRKTGGGVLKRLGRRVLETPLKAIEKFNDLPKGSYGFQELLTIKNMVSFSLLANMALVPELGSVAFGPENVVAHPFLAGLQVLMKVGVGFATKNLLSSMLEAMAFSRSEIVNSNDWEYSGGRNRRLKRDLPLEKVLQYVRAYRIRAELKGDPKILKYGEYRDIIDSLRERQEFNKSMKEIKLGETLEFITNEEKASLALLRHRFANIEKDLKINIGGGIRFGGEKEPRYLKLRRTHREALSGFIGVVSGGVALNEVVEGLTSRSIPELMLDRAKDAVGF